MLKIVEIILEALVAVLGKVLSPDKLNKFADDLLDLIREKVEATPNKIDDKILNWLEPTIRSAFSIKDHDEVTDG